MMTEKYFYPRIKPIYPLYRLNEGEFRIGAQLGITAEFGDPNGQLWALANLLDGRSFPKIINEMQQKFPELSERDIIKGVSILEQEGFVEEKNLPFEEEISERYKANVNYFSHFSDSKANRFEYQKRLNESTVLLLGLGGGGSNILTLLAGIGVKKVIIVDYDKVEESNLGRKLLYAEEDMGRYKTEAAMDAFQRITSQIEIEGHVKKIQSSDDVSKFLEGVDLVICAIDEPPFTAQRIVNKAIVKANIPCVFGASQVSRGRVFTVIPKQTGCFDCLNLKYSMNDPQFLEQFIGFRNVNFTPPTIAYAPAIFQLTAAIVDEAVRIITHYARPKSLGTQYEVDYEEGTSFTHPSWERYSEECPTCGEGNVEDWEIFKYYENYNTKRKP